ncbi:MAG: 3'-5' exonuclease, partial [Algoriphagus sp.]|nr:3'-5' exonuclease [Algoriphagus sp.]
MYLFFDTETTGLPKNYKAEITDLDNWPRLVQLAYLIYSPNGKLEVERNYILKPQNFKIPLEATNIHGIT